MKYKAYTKEWLLKNYFSSYTGTTYTVCSGNCPSFSCVTSSSLLMLFCGAAGHFPRWSLSRRRLSVCSVFRCPDLGLQCSVNFVQGLRRTPHTRIMSFLNRARDSRCTVITDLDTSKRSTQKASSCCMPSLTLALSKHENWTAGNAWETWTVPAADSVLLCPCRSEIRFLITLETAPFFCVC
jgi:hypothetical protein